MRIINRTARVENPIILAARDITRISKITVSNYSTSFHFTIAIQIVNDVSFNFIIYKIYKI